MKLNFHGPVGLILLNKLSFSEHDLFIGSFAVWPNAINRQLCRAYVSWTWIGLDQSFSFFFALESFCIFHEVSIAPFRSQMHKTRWNICWAPNSCNAILTILFGFHVFILTVLYTALPLTLDTINFFYHPHPPPLSCFLFVFKSAVSVFLFTTSSPCLSLILPFDTTRPSLFNMFAFNFWSCISWNVITRIRV